MVPITFCDLEDAVNVGSAYYILSESYYSRGWKREIGYKYMERSLSVFKECNKMALNNYGILIETEDKYLNDRYVDIEYIGKFWKDIVSVLLLGGDILLDSNNLLEHKISINQVIIGRTDKIKRPRMNIYGIKKQIQKLSIIHCHQKQYILSIKYAK